MGGYCEGCGNTAECVCEELPAKNLNGQCDCQSGWICPKCADEMRQLKHDLRKLVDELKIVADYYEETRTIIRKMEELLRGE